MNIGMISEVYGGITTPPQFYGGIGRSVHDITEELVKRGHNVRLFAIEGSRTSGELFVVPAGDAPLYLLDTMPPYVEYAKKHIGWADVWLDGSHHKRFAWWCLENRPEVNIICPSWNPNAIDLPQNPVLQSPHMYEVITGEKGGEHVPWFWFAVPQERYEPIDYAVWPLERPVSINVLSEHKGTDLLVEAAAKHGFPVDLYGPMDVAFFNKKIRRNLRDNIRIMGEIGPERIQILRKSAMSFTLSIWPEPGSLVTIESLTLGCPCVATASGCLKHYIADGVNGAIVERDPDSIFEGYERVLNGGRKMRKAAREMALDMFSMNKFMDNLESVFSRVMDGDRWSL